MAFSSLLRGYIRHWLNAVNQHSLHAPFVYDFYTSTIAADGQQEIFGQIEQYRRQLLQNHEVIKVNSPGAPSRVSRRKSRKISGITAKGISRARNSRLLYRCCARLQPAVIIELGTSLGINTLYLSASCPEATVYTFEGCPETAREARSLFQGWHYQNIRLIEGNIDETLPDALRQITKVDFAYLDANHRYHPTLDYYQQLLARAGKESVFVLDDIYWSAGMRRAWEEIIRRPEVSLSLDLFEMGMVFFRDLRLKQHHYLIY